MPIPQTVEPITLYGLMAEFTDEEALVAAAEKTTTAGYKAVEAYTPFPIEGLAEILGIRGRRLPLIILVGGILGEAARSLCNGMPPPLATQSMLVAGHWQVGHLLFPSRLS